MNENRKKVAVIGAAGIFPGAASLDSLGERLAEGFDAIRLIPENRAALDDLDSSDFPEMAYLDRIDLFDPEFFNLSLSEARIMDPHHRIALELTSRAMLNSGYEADKLSKIRTGVLFAACTCEYYRRIDFEDPTIRTGNRAALLAGRISYAFDLKGPCWTIDTACSSSMVAVHQACQMLINGDMDMALVGGVSLKTLTKREEFSFDKDPLGLRAVNGRCKTFDDAADGIGLGEGGAVVMLKLLQKAEHDNDRIMCVIDGSAVNHDGSRSNGLTAPSPEAQTEVLSAAWEQAGLDPNKLAYIEAHGTGTRLGDPIELQAIDTALRSYGVSSGSCAVGSIKSNLGHLGGAAGLAGFVKVMLSCRLQKLFPSIHVSCPTSYFKWVDSPLYLQSSLSELSKSPFYAGVSSFGLSGTNVHVVLSSFHIKDSDIIESGDPGFNRQSCWINSSASESKELTHVIDDFSDGNDLEKRTLNDKVCLEIVMEIFRETLGVDSVNPDDDFFTLGGNSMLSIAVADKIEKRTGAEFFGEDLFEFSTPIAVSKVIIKKLSGQADSGSSVELFETVYQAPSAAQQRMWILRKIITHPLTGVDFSLFRLKGDLELNVFREALDSVLTRHSAFRQRFKEHEGGLVCYFSDVQDAVIKRVDTGIRSAEDLNLLEQKEIKELINNPPGLENDIPLKLTLIKESSSEVVLLMAIQHIIFDGWSKVLFTESLLRCYDECLSGRCNSPRVLSSYEKYLEWNLNPENRALYEKQLEYWRNHLPENPPVFPMPTDQFPSDRSLNGCRYVLDIPKKLVDSLKNFCSEIKSTPFSVMAFALASIMHLYSRQECIVIGSPVVTRTTRQWRETIGLFLNTVALLFDFNSEDTARELFLRHRDVISRSLRNRNVPYNEVLSAVGIQSKQQLFDVLFDFHNQSDAIQQRDRKGITLEYTPVFPDRVPHALEITVKAVERNWKCLIDYQVDLFDSGEVARFGTHYIMLLQEFLANPDTPLKKISLMDKQERERLLFELNETATDFNIEDRFIDLFRQQVNRSPEAIASREDQKSTSYRDLWRNSCLLADYLKNQGIKPGDIVVVEMQRGENLLTAILAIFNCHAVYLPILPQDPYERKMVILQQAACRFVLCASTKEYVNHNWSVCPDNPKSFQLFIRRDLNETRSNYIHEELAYTIFTSGSTGKPKGAMIKQIGMLNHLFAKISDLQITSNDIIIQNASQGFDISIWQMLSPLIVGGSIRFVDNDVARDPVSLFELICNENISVIEVVPTFLRAFLEMMTPEKECRLQDSSLRWMISTGETLPVDVCNSWISKFKGIPLVNAYGPTECSDDVTHYFITEPLAEGCARVPVGIPIQNTQVYILDDNLKPVPQGAIGEIYVGGLGVGAGYLNEPELTAEAFILEIPITGKEGTVYKTGDIGRIRADGAIDYLGRMDDQIKIHGNRIELEEIRYELLKLSGISDVAVVALDLKGYGPDIFAFVSAARNLDLSTGDLTKYISSKLPAYMIPRQVIFISSLPKNKNGKIDKNKLKKFLENESDCHDLSKSCLNSSDSIGSEEAELLQICRNVIASDNISANDNLIQVGADSLDLIRIVAQANQLGYRFSVKQILSSPTIRELASIRGQNEITGNSSCRGGEEIVLAPMQKWFFKLDLEFPEQWNQIRIFPIISRLSDQHLFQAGQIIAEKHTLLRRGFRRANSGWEGFLISPTLPVPCEVIGGSAVSSSTLMESLSRRVEIVHGTFSLDLPPLVRFIRVRNYSSESDLLCMITHHLISDNISLDILQRDLENVFGQFVSQNRAELPYTSDSNNSFIKSMSGEAIEDQNRDTAKKYDLSGLRTIYQMNLEKDCRELIISIPDIQTKLGAVEVEGSAHLETLLIAGLLESLSDIFDWPFVVLDIGYHGRRRGDVVEGAVGWFATFSPVFFELDSKSTLFDRRAEVQQKIFGIRANSEQLELQCSAVKDYCPNGVSGWVSFDYMGSHSGRDEDFAEFKGELRHPENTRPYLLEIIFRVNNGSLQVILRYPSKAYSHVQMRKLLHLLIEDKINLACKPLKV